jgi:hypothetical protein
VAFPPSSEKSRRLRSIWLILLLALGLRLGWCLTRPTSDASIGALPDQLDYLSLAQNLLHGRGMQFLDKRFDDTVFAFRMPGYPLFLAGCGANPRVIRAMQAVLDTFTVLAIYLLARIIATGEGRHHIALLAAFLVAFNPYLIYFSGLLLSESLFTALLAWGLVLLIRGKGGRGASWRSTMIWLGGALLLGLSVLVRPSAIALPVVLGILSSFVNSVGQGAYQAMAGLDGHNPAGNRKDGKWPLPAGATMVRVMMLCLLPWGLRNRMVLGHWTWLDTNSGFTLYDGYNPDATGASDQSYIDREPELQVLGEVNRSDYLTQKAWEYARTHPARVWRLIGAKLGRTWSPMPLSREYGRPGLQAIAMLYSIPFDLLVVMGLIWGNLPRAAKALLLAPAVYFTIVHALTVGSLRYRVPAEPPMAIIAACALAAWSGTATSWRRA